jgi:flagella basal body P-ring formation protein FlgA
MNFKKVMMIVEVLLVLCTGVAVRAFDCDQAVKDQLMTQLELSPEWYSIDILSSQIKTTNFDDSCSITVMPISQKEPIGLFTIKVTIMKQGQVIETGQISVRIRKFADVIVALDNLTLYSLPIPEKLSLQRMDITSLQEQPIQSLSALAGYRFKRNIGKGQILTNGAVEPVPDIEVGGEVSIICSNGSFTVTAPGQAMQKGTIGGQIKVKNRASGKIVLATVTDGRTVVVQP